MLAHTQINIQKDGKTKSYYWAMLNKHMPQKSPLQLPGKVGIFNSFTVMFTQGLKIITETLVLPTYLIFKLQALHMVHIPITVEKISL